MAESVRAPIPVLRLEFRDGQEAHLRSILGSDLLHNGPHTARCVSETVHTSVDGETATSQNVSIVVDLEAGLVLLAMKRRRNQFDITDLDRFPDSRFPYIGETEHAHRLGDRRIEGGGARNVRHNYRRALVEP